MTSTPTTSQSVALAALRPNVILRGVAFDALTESQIVHQLFEQLTAGQGGWIITANLDILRRATRDADFASMMREADIVTADGMPLVWASRVQGTPLPQRVAGSAMVWSIAAEAARSQRSLFLLGGMPGAAEGAAQVLCERYPGLRVAGTHCPPMGFEHDPAAMAVIEQQLIAAKPDIVYVALGSPKQEHLIRSLKSKDLLPRAWWIGVGISLSFICGQVQRAPRWMQKLGLEWLHRLVQEPGRLAKRYILHGIPFAASLLLTSLAARFHPISRQSPNGL